MEPVKSKKGYLLILVIFVLLGYLEFSSYKEFVDQSGVTAKQITQDALLESIDNGIAEDVRRLLEDGKEFQFRFQALVPLSMRILADPNMLGKIPRGREHGLETPLQTITNLNVSKEKLAIVELLLQKGADVNLTPYPQTIHSPLMTALIFSCTGGCPPDELEVIKRLIKAGANINAIDEHCPFGPRSPLMYAAENFDNDEVAKILLDSGAQVNQSNKKGETPLLLAAQYLSRFGPGFQGSNFKIFDLLVSRGAPVTGVDNAILKGHHLIKDPSKNAGARE